MTNNIIDFYKEKSTDNEGRTITDIFNYDYHQLESIHDYIQWIFPLNEGSSFNYNAPILTKENIIVMKNNEKIKSNIVKSLNLMLDFYGLEISRENSEINIIKNANYEKRSRNWIAPVNHNYLRITRILKFLMLMEMNDYAAAFYKILEEIYNEKPRIIGENTFNYWKRAMAIKSRFS